ncbi:hypothetical protein [Azorhizobium oxalatiphilum]|uniref:hypothetical protein n=1 Tax=Azorhizobium oxalatiphilum TaxID=980631 RepID=UPI00166B162A|nr:hypothetical protein [Azorhizobium oxalatiphilum]
MSAVHNSTEYPWGQLVRMADSPADRAVLVAELAAQTGRSDFIAADGDFRVALPLAVALDHVPASRIAALLAVSRAYTCILLRAAVTSPERFADWISGPGDLHEFPGQGIQLLDDGRIVCDLPGEGGDGVLHHVHQPVAGCGVGPCGVTGTLLCQGNQEVAEEDILRREAAPLDHPEPPVPQRAKPPP